MKKIALYLAAVIASAAFTAPAMAVTPPPRPAPVTVPRPSLTLPAGKTSGYYSCESGQHVYLGVQLAQDKASTLGWTRGDYSTGSVTWPSGTDHTQDTGAQTIRGWSLSTEAQIVKAGPLCK